MVQLLTEAMVLATAGGALGLGLAVLGRNLMWQFRPPQLPAAALDLSLDTHVLLFTMLTALGTGLIFGLAPAWQASRPNLVAELKERAGGDPYSGRRIKLRDVLIALQWLFAWSRWLVLEYSCSASATRKGWIPDSKLTTWRC